MKKIFVSLFTLVLLTSCAASGPVFQRVTAEQNKAILYVYRPSAMVNCCVAPDIYIDETEKGSLKNGGYLVFELSPGIHELKAENESVGFSRLSLDINLKEGKEYYAKWFIGDLKSLDLAAYSSKYNYHLVLLDSEKAIVEISSLKLSGI